ncbi:Uma2 family endonuclease [filamentous cyanobacterium LEGE 11480]|uniref:Uma2 family endonuclease n=1 Tax=Romeriopsis navalis LEGE 11480 TaxID=2777977 RepID=A0A928VS84_9CYAN|nr:Uma2 family endonuclease [Romeriopsis navalis]MBE9032802.1 Uma2 family endonuclease [Romeriopsis navalis LEGE 11480]
MVSTAPTPQNVTTDTWVKATWAEFLVASENSETEKTSCYYNAGRMRIETTGGNAKQGHGTSTLAAVTGIYGTLSHTPFKSLTNSSFQQFGKQECQPDLALYVGKNLPNITRSNKPINLDEHPAPTLVIEIAATTLNDDLGQKRLLYERLGVKEYWVADVESMTITAFAIRDGGSRQIQISQVFPNLAIAIVETALQRSQTEDDSSVNRWLMQEFAQ